MDKILFRNGMVYDPIRHKMEKRDLALADGFIVDAVDFTPNIVVDADECIITPGLIDFHVHCYTGGSDGTNEADSFCLPNGVTTCVDSGTAGTANYEGIIQNVVSRCMTRVMTLLHVAPEGLTTGRHPENQTPADWDLEMIHLLCRKYPDVIVGLKVRMDENVLDSYGLREEPLAEAIKLAEELGKRVIVHVNNPNVGCERVAELLRPGDVFCHMYAGSRCSILDENGKVRKGILEARERGVIFDACNGKGQFLFDVAEKCIAQVFLPDIISTDMNPKVFFKHPVISMPRLLSRYLMLGLDIKDVFDRVTVKPAHWLGLEDLASMDVGTTADIAVWKLNNKRVVHKDTLGKERWGDQVLVPQMTVKGGVIFYCQADFM